MTKKNILIARKPRDDRVCDLGAACLCKRVGEQAFCTHFHLPNPHVISAYSAHRKKP